LANIKALFQECLRGFDLTRFGEHLVFELSGALVNGGNFREPRALIGGWLGVLVVVHLWKYTSAPPLALAVEALDCMSNAIFGVTAALTKRRSEIGNCTRGILCEFTKPRWLALEASFGAWLFRAVFLYLKRPPRL